MENDMSALSPSLPGTNNISEKTIETTNVQQNDFHHHSQQNEVVHSDELSTSIIEMNVDPIVDCSLEKVEIDLFSQQQTSEQEASIVNVELNGKLSFSGIHSENHQQKQHELINMMNIMVEHVQPSMEESSIQHALNQTGDQQAPLDSIIIENDSVVQNLVENVVENVVLQSQQTKQEPLNYDQDSILINDEDEEYRQRLRQRKSSRLNSKQKRYHTNTDDGSIDLNSMLNQSMSEGAKEFLVNENNIVALDEFEEFDDDGDDDEDDDELDDEDDEDDYDDEDEEMEVINEEQQPPQTQSQQQVRKGRRGRRSKSKDQDFVLNDDLINNEIFDDDSDDDDDDDDDDYDGYRPLKKRRLVRRRKVRKISQKVQAKLDEIKRLHGIIFKLRSNLLITKRYSVLLANMNGCLVDKMFNLINGDCKQNVSNESLFDSMKTLYEDKQLPSDVFLIQFPHFIMQFNALTNEKQEFESNIDQEVEPKIVEQSLRKFISPKKNVPVSQMVNDDATIQKMFKLVPKARKQSKLTTSKNTGATAQIASNSETSNSELPRKSQRKRKRRSKKSILESGEGEKEGNHYFPCPWPDCTYESKREWALNEHVNLTHTGLKQFGCKVEDCPATFFGSAELGNHMKKFHADLAQKEFMPCTWPGCNALFKSKLGLRAHLQGHRGENLIPCDWPGCNYQAKNKRQHENHTRKHTGDRPFACDYLGCDAKFRTNDSLRHHKKSHSEYRPFHCDWPGCEAHFKTNRGLTIHRALHTGEKLFKCDYPNCDFASERKYHVDLHIYEQHTHRKPYECTWTGCDASFLRNDKLQNHLKIHRQEKPFKCIHPTCDKHFVEKGNMMKHFNNVHKR